MLKKKRSPYASRNVQKASTVIYMDVLIAVTSYGKTIGLFNSLS